MMAVKRDLFLESKIRTPGVSRSFILRQRLITRLQEAGERLIVVCAGMGYGKTVLLTHYAAHCPELCAWYHLSETDNDIMTFVRYLEESIRRVFPELEMDLSPYAALELNRVLVQSLTLEFSTALRALGDRKLTLVLDDFQVLENEHIFQLLSELLENTGENLKIILCTKSCPPTFCARYLMEDRALMLGMDALAFNLEETEEIIRDYTRPQELEETARALLTESEGWPAGVSFALLYFRQQQEPIREQNLEQACRQSYLWDYFMHELYRKLPFELQHFLVNTAVLEFLQPGVCNALAGIDNAGAQLAYLMQENLFILRLSDKDSYRYHSLFREFLLAQLQPEQRREQCRKAAAFFLRSPDKARAVEYAIAGEDPELLQLAVETAGQEALKEGRLDTVRRWLEKLRESGVRLSAESLLLEGTYSERMGFWQEALELSEQAEAQAQPESVCALQAGLLRAKVAREHISEEKSLEILEELRPRLCRKRRALAEVQRQALWMKTCNLLDSGRPREALDLVLERLEDAARCGKESDQLWIRELAVKCCCALGDYRRAMKTYVVLRSHGGSSAVTHDIQLYLAVSGKPGQALVHLNRTVEETDRELYPWTLEGLILAQALVEQIARLEGVDSQNSAHRFLEGAELNGSFSALFSQLGRMMEDRPDPEGEERLFHPDTGRLLTIQDGLRWLTVRRHALRGETDRALELCREARALHLCWTDGEVPRRNAFTVFLTLEEALLTAPRDPAHARELLAQHRAYVEENHLQCPGLTEEERLLLHRLLGEENLPEEPEARVRVRCFGRLQVLLPDGEELHWRTRKAQELFAYLFHLGGELADREKLVDLLWPESPPANATSLLHTTLYSIRKTLTPYGLDRLILREKKGYRMDMDLTVSDRQRLEAVLKGEAPEDQQLEQLYTGPYLEDVDGAWAESPRAWYASAFLRMSRETAKKRMASGDFRGAVSCLRRAMEQEPYDEELASQMMLCFSSQGQIKHVMSLYKRLKQTLEQDLGAEPDAETTRIYRDCLVRRLSSEVRA